MQSVYQVMATYQHDRFHSLFGGYVDTEYTVYGDRLSAELTADLFNLLLEEDYGVAVNLGLHGDSEPVKFWVQELSL